MLAAEADRIVQEICSTLGAIERYFVRPLGDLRVRARRVQALRLTVCSQDPGELGTALASAVAAREALSRVRAVLVDWLLEYDQEAGWITPAIGETQPDIGDSPVATTLPASRAASQISISGPHPQCTPGATHEWEPAGLYAHAHFD